ncbi:MAG: NAD-dependent malic enzyme, partial [Acidimicrobiia bacterium]|nr:NAD-dependent malic enzyme [Acidimicrobiia bacterium]
PVDYQGSVRQIGQANNMFVFPAMGLGTLAVGATRVTEGMFLAAAGALAAAVDDEQTAQGSLFPRIVDVREVSRTAAIAIGEQAIGEGLASDVPDVAAVVDDLMWWPDYLPYRPA